MVFTTATNSFPRLTSEVHLQPQCSNTVDNDAQSVGSDTVDNDAQSVGSDTVDNDAQSVGSDTVDNDAQSVGSDTVDNDAQSVGSDTVDNDAMYGHCLSAHVWVEGEGEVYTMSLNECIHESVFLPATGAVAI